MAYLAFNLFSVDLLYLIARQSFLMATGRSGVPVGGVGAFTTDELLNWFNTMGAEVPDVPTKNVATVPAPGTAKYKLKLQAQAAEKERRALEGEEEEEEEKDDENEDESVPYEESFNQVPDDWEYLDDFGPGRPTNPKAQPGDDDYEVDQLTSVYEDFSFENDTNPALPIHEFKDTILDTISSREVSLVLL